MANKKVSSKKKKSQPRGGQNGSRAEQTAKTGQEDPREVITLAFDDDSRQDCFIEGVFDCGGQDYIALVPDDMSGDVYIYRYIQEGDDDYRLEDETDEAKFAAAVREYEDIIGYQPEA